MKQCQESSNSPFRKCPRIFVLRKELGSPDSERMP